MDTTPPPITTSAAFDSNAVFEPTISPDTVQITGTATNSADIANIEFYDGSTDLGGTGQFQGSRWVLTENFSPGTHDLKAVVTELDGATYGFIAPYDIVTGVKNQPYVFQELDKNSAGVVNHVSNYDGSGNLVSQTSIAVNGSGAAPLSVAFDPSTTFMGATEGLITGTTTSYGSATSIEIFDGTASKTVDPQTGAVLSTATPLGYATVNPNGTWSFDAHVSPGTHVFTAVATGLAGAPAVAQSSFTLVTGVTGSPYVYEEIDHNASGAVSATTSYAADGSIVGRSAGGGLTINGGGSSGNVLQSSYEDVMTGDGTGATTFAFKPGFGQDEITNFNYLNAAQSPTGISHDIISLPRAEFQKLAQVFHHTTTALDGSAVIHLDRQDTIKIDGVTKADLITHPNVFRFHN